MVDLQPYDWLIKKRMIDNRQDEFHIWCLTKGEESKTVLVRVNDCPNVCYLKLPKQIQGRKIYWTKNNNIFNLTTKLKKVLGDGKFFNHKMDANRRVYNYQARRTNYLALYFHSVIDAQTAARRIENGFSVKLVFNRGYESRFTYFKSLLLEADIDPIVKLHAVAGTKPSQWFRLDKKPNVEERIAIKEIDEYLVSYKDIKPINKEETESWQTTPLMMSFDIETFSDRHNQMPNKEDIANPITMIAFVVERFGKPETRKTYIVNYGCCYNLYGCDVIQVKDEKELLQKSCEIIIKYRPNIMTGHNIFGYDYVYTHTRFMKYGLKWPNCSFLENHQPIKHEKLWKSSAYQTVHILYPTFDGIVNIDTLKYVRRDYKLPSYRLDVVARYFLGRGKNPVTAKQMFKAFGWLTQITNKFTDEEIELVKKYVLGNKYIKKMMEEHSKLTNILTEAQFVIEKYIKDNKVHVISLNSDKTIKQQIKEWKSNKIKSLDDLTFNAMIKFKVKLKRKEVFDWYNKNKKEDLLFTDHVETFTNFEDHIGQIVNLLVKEDILDELKEEQFKHIKDKLDKISKRLGKQGFVIKDLIELFDAIYAQTIVADYCRIDAVRCNELLNCLEAWIVIPQMGNICQVPINYLYTRGQQIRTMSILYNEFKKKKYVIEKRMFEKMSYEGGFVGDPVSGIYERVVCMDFTSLYPTIMIAFNICYTTCLSDEQAATMPKAWYNTYEWTEVREVEVEIEQDEEDYSGVFGLKQSSKYEKQTVTTNFRVHIIKPEIKRGIMPELLNNFLMERKVYKKKLAHAKKMIKESKTAEEKAFWRTKKALYNAIQLGLKVPANSAYGFLGASAKGMLPYPQLAALVTMLGRFSTKTINKWIEEDFDGKIIYNDTDSTMPQIGLTDETKHLHIKKSEEICAVINRRFIPPINLDWEKSMLFAILTAKRYAYFPMDYKTGDYLIGDDDLISKGIILSRRDNCLKQRQIFMRVLCLIIIKRNYHLAYQYLLNSMKDIVFHNFGWEEMSIIRGMGDNYKSDTYFMYIFGQELKRLGKPCQPGDRLEYLIVEDRDKRVNDKGKVMLGHKMRLPETFKERLESDRPERIDHVYYLEKILCNCITQLFEKLLKPQVDEIYKKREYVKVKYDILSLLDVRVKKFTDLNTKWNDEGYRFRDKFRQLLINCGVNVKKLIKSGEVDDVVRKIYLENKPEKGRRRHLLDTLNADKPVINFVKYIKHQKGLIKEIGEKMKDKDYNELLKDIRVEKEKLRMLRKKDKKRRKGKCYMRVDKTGKMISEEADVDTKLESIDLDLTAVMAGLDIDGILS